MVCIYCGDITRVVNSRHKRRDNHTWRRRACQQCGALFTTTEQPDLPGSIVMRTLNGQLEPFNRDKLFLSIYKSCGHRQTAVSDATGLTQIIISNVLQRPDDGTLTTSTIAAAALQALQRFDATAATIYSAFYRPD